jgi:hypothetical protein
MGALANDENKGARAHCVFHGFKHTETTATFKMNQFWLIQFIVFVTMLCGYKRIC